MDEHTITIGQLKALAEIQKAGIDACCDYGNMRKAEGQKLKRTIDFLVNAAKDYAKICSEEE